MDAIKKRAIKRAIDGKTSNWLTVLPVACHYFNLSPMEFRGALALQYHRPLLNMPVECNGCGSDFSLEHALDCRKGGLITQCHNEVRDALGEIAAMAFKEVIREPIVREADYQRGVSTLIANLGIIGVWQPQTEAFF